MQNAILRIQWKACWHLVIALSVAAFALPIVSVRVGWHEAASNLPLFLTELELWGLFYPVLAGVSALIVALGIWMSDRRGGHVYALLLPVSRSRYLLWYRYSCRPGALACRWWRLCGPGRLSPAAASTCRPASGSSRMRSRSSSRWCCSCSSGSRSRFASASSRTVGLAIRVLAGLFLAVHVAVLLLAPQTNVLLITLKALATWPGPLAALGGRWMLIDA